MVGIIKVGRLFSGIGTSVGGGAGSPDVKQDTGDQTTSGASSDTASFPSYTVTGNGIIVVFALKSGRRVSSVTDNKGNTYSQVGFAVDENDAVVEMWYCQPIVGGTSHTLTVNYDGVAYVVWGAMECSRVQGGSFLDSRTVRTTVRNGTGSSASVTVTSGVPRSAGELFVGMLALAGGGADAGIDTPTNYTRLIQFNDFDSVMAGHGAYRVNGTSAAVSATWTNDTTTAPAAAIIAGFRGTNATSAGTTSDSSVLAADESNALALDFTDNYYFASTGRWGSAYIVDLTTPANNYDSVPDNLLTYTSPSPKVVLGPTGVMGYRPHNYMLHSDDMTQAAWTLSNASRTATTITDSDGANTGYIAQSVTIQAYTTYAFSCRVLKDAVAAATRVIRFEFFGTHHMTMATDTAAYAVTAGSLGVAITDDGTYWRVLITMNAGANTDLALKVYPAVGTGISPTTVAGATTGSVTVDQFQLRRTPTDRVTYLATTTAAKFTLPFEWETTGALRGLRVEGGHTNKITQSIDFTVWTKTASTVSGGAATGPAGDDEADNVVPDGTSSAEHNVTLGGLTTTAATHCFSVFAKANGYNFIEMIVGSTAAYAKFAAVTFNVSTGAYVSQRNTTYTIANYGVESYPGGWYRCWFTTTTDANSTHRTDVKVCSTSTPTAAYTGDTTSGVLLWQAQLEDAPFPTSPIVTVGGTLARVADAITIATTRYPHSATVNSAWIRYAALNVSNAMTALRWDDGTANEVVSIGHSSSAVPGLTVTDGGVAQTAPLTSGTVAASTFSTIAVSWKANDFLLSNNGAAAAADTSGTLPTVTSLDIGPTLYGHISRILVVPVEKTAAEVATMATP